VHTERYIATVHINKGVWKSAYVHIGYVGNASIFVILYRELGLWNHSAISFGARTTYKRSNVVYSTGTLRDFA